MNKSLTLALAQADFQIGNIEANFQHIFQIVGTASKAGAQMVIFPELALTGYNPDILSGRMNELALSANNNIVKELLNIAKLYGIYLIVGFIERRKIPGVYYNSILVGDPAGRLIDIYAKSHLFSGENLHFRAGDIIKPFNTEFGMVGPMICMDIGYPEVARTLCLQGAELLIAPSAWIAEDEYLWKLQVRARAVDNFVFVAAVDRIGKEGNLRYIGQSMVVNPRGEIIAELGEKEDLLICEINLDEVSMARRRAMHLTGRRPDLYHLISSSYKDLD